MPAPAPLAVLVAQATTTTTEEEVPRIVGEPLPTWQVVGAGLALLVVILVAGFLVRGRARRGPGTPR